MIAIALIVIFILACRFLPGPKCITYCKLKQFKRKLAVAELEKFAIFDAQGRYVGADFGTTPIKKLIKLYKNTEPFGCSQLTINGTWLLKTREILKETIVEKQLLEVK